MYTKHFYIKREEDDGQFGEELDKMRVGQIKLNNLGIFCNCQFAFL